MPSVLIVEDTPFMRNMLKEIFYKNGYEIAGEAENGQQGVDLYRELKPDIVTMDITMPEKNGLEAVQEIIAFDKNARIVMCSAIGQQAIVIECIKAGALDFIVKPFAPDKVMQACVRVLDIKEV